MRWSALFVVLLATVAEARSPAPRRPPPPIDRHCTVTESSAKLAECIATHARGSTVVPIASDLQRVRTLEGREYLFVKFGERWRLIYRPGDANYELVGRSELKVGADLARRIDLGHHVQLGNRGMFHERVSLVCRGEGCAAFVTACTVLQRGRAVETFRGELRVTREGAMTIEGDRSHATSICRGR
ncbi:MAG: hypothetical protein JNL83_11465 [Myxococcales bacterium]|nr:hypothetical protein [Myxococcales bacterium]